MLVEMVIPFQRGLIIAAGEGGACLFERVGGVYQRRQSCI
jgi:hypothetical protein